MSDPITIGNFMPANHPLDQTHPTSPPPPKQALANNTPKADVNMSDSARATNHTNHYAKAQFQVDGMSCQACATRIEKVLHKKPGVAAASVSFAGETVNVQYDDRQTNVEQLTDWINKTGFVARPLVDNAVPMLQAQSKDWRLILIWLCLAPFLVGMVGMLVGQGMHWMPPLWLQFVLATVVQFGLATPFYHSAWASIKGRLANMDVLVVLGTLTIWVYSTFVWLQSLGISMLHPASVVADIAALNATDLMTQQGGHVPVYFEAAVMVIAFVRLGKYLEHRTKRHSLNSINLLLELTPTQVERVSNVSFQHQPSDTKPDATMAAAAKATNPEVLDATVETVALSEVAVGDILRAKQGARIATDGIVVSGAAWLDESHLTGESVPLDKQVGDKVLAGAMIDNGSVNYRVTAIGGDTQLSDMVKALSEAQGSKADLARLADKVAAVFVPVVVVIALLTFALTWWITGAQDKAVLHAVSVLVIACPCALGLATPAAIMAGMGVAARHGVWFKDAQSLEAAGSVDTVVFDKTGTLTKGRPQLVASMMVDNSVNSADVLQLAASVEAHASHPLATAVVTAATAKNLPLLSATDINVISGRGVEAMVTGYGLVQVGTPEFVGLKLPKNLPKVWNVASSVAVGIDGVPLGMFALADELKDESGMVVKTLKADGLDVVLLSGDKASVVAQVADTLQLATATGQMSPRDKAQWIEAHQATGHKVAMVGDGVNDAPAMATAYASFSMLHGTEIAKHSASARLMGESLLQVHSGIDIAKATLRNIKQNLFFAFIYNCLGIPLAAFGFLSPMLAAAAMALSSISVLMNALRLTRYKG